MRRWLPLLVLLTLPGVASATTMVRATVEQLASASDVVVLGRVRRATATTEGPQRGVFTEVELEVEEVWRGEADGAVRFWVHGGRVGGRAMQTHGQARFVPHERVVVFLAGSPRFPTGMSQGRWVVHGDVVRSGADAGSLFARDGAGRLAPAAPLGPMRLDELRARVEAAP